MVELETKNIAGMSLKGGKKNQFFFSLLEYFEDQERWFLKSLLQVRDEKEMHGDDAIRSWIDKYQLKQLVVDVPLSYPAYHEQSKVHLQKEQESVAKVLQMMEDFIKEDERRRVSNPKKYEQERNIDDTFNFHKDVMSKEPHVHILTRSFKRKLKKGFVPYWNRTVDFYIWMYYYDQLLDLFNVSYDSFGNTSLLNQFRFDYLRSHFPSSLELFEGNFQIALIELLRSGIILNKDIQGLSDLEEVVEARFDIIEKIETSLNIFIYDHDLEILVKNPRAFESFILSVIGQNSQLEKNRKLPEWALPERTKFLVPSFS
ncbi:MAG: hypothetical protein KC493_06085 [Bacteriovoracaceae bacterium]|nr:hypothetical protein [Bacteriovoracaceae bacterium]